MRSRVRPELAGPSRRGRLCHRAHVSVGRVEPRAVRHQKVQEVERRLRLRRPERRDEAVEVPHATDVEGVSVHLRELLGELARGVRPEVSPRLVDHRQAVLERGRREQVEIHDPRVAVQRGQARLGARTLALADLRRTESRLRLRDDHAIAARQEREQVVRIVLRGRQRAADRRVAGQDRRNRLRRRRRQRARVAEPRRLSARAARSWESASRRCRRLPSSGRSPGTRRRAGRRRESRTRRSPPRRSPCPGRRAARPSS